MSATGPAREAFVERRRIEFDRCLHSFADQFREWKERTETPAWASHYSQVRAIETLLVGVCERVKAEAEGAKVEPDFPEILPEFEKVVLSGWRVWEFFRGKLAQRQEEQFQAGLRAADELAWACRMPLAEAALAAGTLSPKEPALVFLNGNASPVALARGRSFWPESAPGMGQLDELCNEFLLHVPVPLISLPWHEVWHAPSLTAVAHEAGHVVEEDFQLARDLDAALEAAVSEAGVPEQKADWLKWRAEIFADFFAVRQCGPGYVGMLSDVMIGTNSDTSKYPPSDLRLELCFAGLRHLGLDNEAKTRRAAWRQLTETREAAEPAVKVAASVVKKIAGKRLGAFGGKTLGVLVAFDPQRLEHSWRIARSLAEGRHPDSPSDPQLLATAARLLYEEKPEAFATDAASLDVFGLIATFGAGQRRGIIQRGSVGGGPSSEQAKDAIHRAADKLLSSVHKRRRNRA